MPEAVMHPTPEELTAFGLGKLPERAAAVVAAHLEKCPSCRQVVAGVSSDSFVDKVRAAKPDGSSFPPSFPQPGNAPINTSRPAMPNVVCPDVPPELARHPKFLILRELGRGGMGVVYQARQTMMNRQVVIKVINRSLLEQPGALERFRREVQAAAQLSHPNIVTAYDAEQAGELHMLVMEFVPGQSLAEVLQKKGPLPVANACHYMRQVALGLQHAQERNMVHRDIKPSNLMLTPQGRVKILDFGLAKIVSECDTGTVLTASNAYMGTPDYCSPEQAKNPRTADIRADLYSLGCTLYCLLAGRPPFREDTPMNTILAHVQKKPQPLRELRPDVPAELWQVVKRLLAKEPAQRYQKPIDVFRALSAFVKPGTKPDAKSGSAPEQKVVTPEKGTRLAAGSEQIEKVPREVPGKAKPREVPAKDEAASPFENLRDTSSPARRAKEATEPTRRAPTVWSRLWPALAGAVVMLLLMLGLWKSGVLENKPAKSKESPKEQPPEPPNFPNSIGMDLVLVKPGTFEMGSPENEAGRFPDDEFQHKVEITRSFYMGKYEVTQGQYERVMNENPSFFSVTGGGKEKVLGEDTREFPVENVSWHKVVEFCHRLSELPEEKAKGRLYRLPTEAEWEYTCRGGPFIQKNSPPFHFGHSLSSDLANFDGNFPYGDAPRRPYYERTAKVGSYRQNPHPLGIYDLHGNVGEWCADWYDGAYYRQSPPRNPEGPKLATDYHVSRGGSWYFGGSQCRAAYRGAHSLNTRTKSVGFRVVMEQRLK